MVGFRPVSAACNKIFGGSDMVRFLIRCASGRTATGAKNVFTIESNALVLKAKDKKIRYAEERRNKLKSVSTIAALWLAGCALRRN